jgi:hypothetical protein
VQRIEVVAQRLELGRQLAARRHGVELFAQVRDIRGEQMPSRAFSPFSTK